VESGQERLSGLQEILLASRPALLRFLKARGADQAAEDLLQDLWLQAAAVAPETVAQPLAYLYRMADNLVTARARSESRRQVREQAWTQAMHDPAPAEMASGERSLIAREQIGSVEAVLARLGERTETIFRRFRLDGLTQAQIAGELGISLSTVEKHLQRAYRALVDFRSSWDA
jgi:RNA polymerase sigma-70 factor (ECF subfamily)